MVFSIQEYPYLHRDSSLKNPDIFYGAQDMSPVYAQGFGLQSSSLALGVWDLHSCCFCAGELGYSSEAFLSLQMTSP